MIEVIGIRSLVGFGTPGRALAHLVLYPRHLIHEAIPKYISGRTSYHVFCLAFHSYPQLIRDFCNNHQFGPPSRVTDSSPWPWVDQHASGLLYATESPYSDSLSLRLRLDRLNLATYSNSLSHYAKGTPSDIPLTRHSPRTVCKHTVSGSISLPSRGSFRLSLTVLVHYRSLVSI